MFDDDAKIDLAVGGAIYDMPCRLLVNKHHRPKYLSAVSGTRTEAARWLRRWRQKKRKIKELHVSRLQGDKLFPGDEPQRIKSVFYEDNLAQ